MGVRKRLGNSVPLKLKRSHMRLGGRHCSRGGLPRLRKGPHASDYECRKRIRGATYAGVLFKAVAEAVGAYALLIKRGRGAC